MIEASENISHKKPRRNYDHTSSDSDSYDTHSRRRRKKQTKKSHKKKSKHGGRHHSKHKGIVIFDMTKKFDLSQDVKGEDQKTEILITLVDIVHSKNAKLIPKDLTMIIST